MPRTLRKLKNLPHTNKNAAPAVILSETVFFIVLQSTFPRGNAGLSISDPIGLCYVRINVSVDRVPPRQLSAVLQTKSQKSFK